MTSSTGINRIKCGQIYILSNDNFSIICEFCDRDFLDLEAFRTHVSDHFPEKSSRIKIEDCRIDIKAIKQEIQDDLFENLPDNQQNEVASLAEFQLLEDETSGPLNNTPSEETETEIENKIQAGEQYEENNHSGKPNEILELQASSENKNITNVKVKKNTLRRSTRKIIEPRIEESVLQDDKIKTDITDTIDSFEPNIDSASASSEAGNISKTIRKKGFKCSFCPKIFRQRRDHAEHENIHAGRQPYKCTICFKTFARAQSLNYHHNVHRGDMPYECSMCDKKFNAKSRLNCHIRESHLPDTDPRRYFPCKPCNMKFESRSRLTYHRLSKHKRNDKEAMICDYCLAKFASRKNLIEHMNGHTRSKLYTCQFCNKSYPYRNSKSKHERTQHRDIAF